MGTARLGWCQYAPLHRGATEDTASVSSRIWFDRDADGVQDEAEPGYERAGVVILYQGDEQVGCYDTDADGHYTIDGLAPGDYRVANMDNGVYLSTTAIYQDVSLASGDAAEANFGMKGGVVSGQAWLDEDRDGVFDDVDGEGAPPDAYGATVYLHGPAGLEFSMTLDQGGRYAFHDLPNGLNYQITAPAMDGLAFTSSGGDSAVDPATGTSNRMEIWQGTEFTADIGYLTPAPVEPAPSTGPQPAAGGVQPAADTKSTSDTTAKAAGTKDLAHTGVSPILALAAGGGLLFFLRRCGTLS